MNYGEVYSALETGTLDAVEINLTSIESEKHYEIAKNVTLTGQYFWPSFLLVNRAKFAALSPEQRDAIRKAADEIVEPQVMAVAELDKKLMQDFAARSLERTGARSVLLDVSVVETYVKKTPLMAAFVQAAERLRAAPRVQ